VGDGLTICGLDGFGVQALEKTWLRFNDLFLLTAYTKHSIQNWYEQEESDCLMVRKDVDTM
jgi:hypothetical protein